MKPLDRLSDYLGAVERRLRIAGTDARGGRDGRGGAGSHGAGRAGGQPLRLLRPQRAGRAPVSLSGAGAGPGRRADRAGDPPQPAPRGARGRRPLSTIRGAPADLHRKAGAESAAIRSCRCWRTTRSSWPARPHPASVARTTWIFSFSSAAIAFALALIWLGTSGPGFLGYGTSLLWGGLPKGDMKPFYAIQRGPRQPHRAQALRPGDHRPSLRASARPACASSPSTPALAVGAGGDAAPSPAAPPTSS